MENIHFVIRYRTRNMTPGKLSLPIDLYSPEECEWHAEAIRREGYTQVTTDLEAHVA